MHEHFVMVVLHDDPRVPAQRQLRHRVRERKKLTSIAAGVWCEKPSIGCTGNGLPRVGAEVDAKSGAGF